MTLRIHHLNCGSMCPYCERLMTGQGSWLRPARMVSHCLLVEGRNHLTLVDTGLGTADISQPQRLGGVFRSLVRPTLQPHETALAQVRALGFSPQDVRHIVVTHLDLDHAGGLADFPQAQVHVFAAEHSAAMQPVWRERMRYLPHQWAHEVRWQLHRPQGERWFGFDGLQVVPGSDDDIRLIPLPGHTRGHCGVAVRQPGTGDARWLLHCGDAYFSRQEVQTPASCPAGLRFFQAAVEMQRSERLDNQRRLRELALAHSQEVDLICAHDPLDLERFAPAQGGAVPA